MNIRSLLFVPVGILLALPEAALAGKLEKRTIEVKGPLESIRPSPPIATSSLASPRLTLDEFVGRQQARIQDISDRQIVQLQRLVQLAGPDDALVPDYFFRLGELLSEKHRFLNGRARGRDEPIFRAEQAHDAQLAGRLRREQAREQQQAEHALHKAIAYFATAMAYARYPRMDEVLFRLGYALALAGRADKARECFHRLVKDFPQSRYVPDAYLSFADEFFAKGDMVRALAFYTKVSRFPRSSVFGYALYKKAWAEANLSELKAALGTFVDLIEQCEAGKIGQAQRVPLEKEARRDLVKVYARTPGADADRAWDFFRRVGGNEAPHMMQALAELYWEQGMASLSSRVYRRMMLLEPRSSFLCAWQDKVLRNTLSAGTEPEQVQEMQRLGHTYHYVQQMGGVKADIVAECRGRYHDTTRELAFILHKQAERLKRLPTFELAAAAYREFLSAFASEPTSTEVAFFYAECLWRIASLSPASPTLWREAAEQYTRVIELNPTGPYVKDAAYAAVLAWQNVLYEDDSDLHASPHGRS